MHQSQVAIGGYLAGQSQAAGAFVYAQDGSDQAYRVVILPKHGKRKQQAGSRQVLRRFAKIALVDTQGGLAIQFVKHVSVAARHLSGRPESLPSSKGTVAKAQLVAAEADGHYPVVGDAVPTKRP